MASTRIIILSAGANIWGLLHSMCTVSSMCLLCIDWYLKLVLYMICYYDMKILGTGLIVVPATSDLVSLYSMSCLSILQSCGSFYSSLPCIGVLGGNKAHIVQEQYKLYSACMVIVIIKAYGSCVPWLIISWSSLLDLFIYIILIRELCTGLAIAGERERCVYSAFHIQTS